MMPAVSQPIPPAYRAVMWGATPLLKWWGTMTVEGLEVLPPDGPCLVVANHDSYWDPVAVGTGALPVRPVRALAKASMWGNPLVGKVLDGMGQIPIKRGESDVAAMERAVQELRDGACIGVFPEGTRSLGRELRARSGVGRLAEAVPEAQVVSVAISGTTDVPRFPKRSRVRLQFFRPEGGGLQPGEAHGDFAARLVRQCRALAPIAKAGRRP
jgi:1-acyl-sn-glycerol-3-phosphate acyltransferase